MSKTRHIRHVLEPDVAKREVENISKMYKALGWVVHVSTSTDKGPTIHKIMVSKGKKPSVIVELEETTIVTSLPKQSTIEERSSLPSISSDIDTKSEVKDKPFVKDEAPKIPSEPHPSEPSPKSQEESPRVTDIPLEVEKTPKKVEVQPKVEEAPKRKETPPKVEKAPKREEAPSKVEEAPKRKETPPKVEKAPKREEAPSKVEEAPKREETPPKVEEASILESSPKDKLTMHIEQDETGILQALVADGALVIENGSVKPKKWISREQYLHAREYLKKINVKL